MAEQVVKGLLGDARVAFCEEGVEVGEEVVEGFVHFGDELAEGLDAAEFGEAGVVLVGGLAGGGA